MPGKLGTLTLDLVAKIGGFTGPLDKADKHTKKTASNMSKYGKAFGLAIAGGATAAATALVYMVQKQRTLIDEQAKIAQALGTTYDSVSNLKRAADLTGLSWQQLTVVGRQLDLNIGKALNNEKLQADAFKRIGIEAKEIANLPLDEKIAKVNSALVKNVAAAERSAVAMDLFGAKNAFLSRLLTADVIGQAAREIEIFGLNLGDVDAAKVELANDAMSTFGLLSQGITKQLTVELAPILQAIGNKFLDTAEEAGGLGNIVQDSVRKVVGGLGFVIDAGDGVKRTFQIVADGIIYALATGQEKALELAAGVLDILDYIPGLDLSLDVESLRQSAKEAEGVAKLAGENIEKTLEKPFSGAELIKVYDKIQEESQGVAEATIKVREEALKTGEAFDETAAATDKAADQIKKQIEALEKAKATWGKTADEVKLYELKLEGADEEQLKYAESLLKSVAGLEASKKAHEDYKSLLDELQTSEEKLSSQLEDRLKILSKIDDISSEDRKKAIQKIVDAGFTDAPKYEGLAPELGGPFGELSKLEDTQKELDKWYKTQLEMLAEFRQKHAELNDEWDAQALEKKKEYEDQILKIEQARQVLQVQGAAQVFGELAGLASAFGGEQSAAYKRLLVMQKAASLASVLLSSADAIGKAWASAPFPYNIPAVATTTIQTGALQAVVSSVSLAGVAHSGINSVPEDGTWLLKKGERVTTAETSAKLDSMIEDIRKGGMIKGGPRLVQNIHVSGVPDSRTSGQMARDASRKQAQIQQRLG